MKRTRRMGNRDVEEAISTFVRCDVIRSDKMEQKQNLLKYAKEYKSQHLQYNYEKKTAFRHDRCSSR